MTLELMGLQSTQVGEHTDSLLHHDGSWQEVGQGVHQDVRHQEGHRGVQDGHNHKVDHGPSYGRCKLQVLGHEKLASSPWSLPGGHDHHRDPFSLNLVTVIWSAGQKNIISFKNQTTGAEQEKIFWCSFFSVCLFSWETEFFFKY